jgi:hypothetical protein
VRTWQRCGWREKTTLFPKGFVPCESWAFSRAYTGCHFLLKEGNQRDDLRLATPRARASAFASKGAGMSNEVNKIAGAILGMATLAMGVGFFSGALVSPKAMTKAGYELPDNTGAASASAGTIRGVHQNHRADYPLSMGKGNPYKRFLSPDFRER